jgi:hypothetical protein
MALKSSLELIMSDEVEPNKAQRSNRDYSLGKGIAVGIAIGAGIGVAMHDIAIGVGIGVALGVAIGSMMGRTKKDN